MPSGTRWLHDLNPFERAAEILATDLREAVQAGGSPRLAIPGGSAMAAVAPTRKRLGMNWEQIRLTWVDERCVPATSPDSNRGTAARAGLLNDPGPALALPLYEDGESGLQAVTRCEAALAEQFDRALDVALLGMGEDGHVASLFPEAAPPGERARVAHVTSSPKPPAERITLTLKVLNTASHCILVAAGESKRRALDRLARGDPTLPASSLSRLTVITDLSPDTFPGDNR